MAKARANVKASARARVKVRARARARARGKGGWALGAQILMVLASGPRILVPHPWDLTQKHRNPRVGYED